MRTIRVFVSTSNWMPAGGGTRTGCENPTNSIRSLPSISGRYPTPSTCSSRVNPRLTPTTMFWSSARVSPCLARMAGSSLLRCTATMSPRISICIPSGKLRSSSPFGPWTRTRRPSMCTCTPAGMGTGMRPILDTPSSSALPDLAQDFAANSQLAGASPGHDSLGSRHDGHPESRTNPRDFGLAAVHAPPRPADTAQAGDDGPPVAPLADVLEADAQHGARLALRRCHLDRFDEPLLLKNEGDGRLHLRAGDRDRGVPGQQPVADAGQQVSNRIRYAHRLRLPPPTTTTWPRRGGSPAGPVPGSRCGTTQSGACSRAGGRTCGSGGAPRSE